MNRDDYARIRRVFEETYEQSAEARAAAIARAFPDRDDLRAEVEKLLSEFDRIVTAEGSDPRVDGIADGPRFQPGALVAGRYRIAARIGSGGMGEVYRAEDQLLGQTVALKFLPAALGADPDWRRRFQEEVRIARSLRHPALCQVFDMGEADGDAFITMEYIDGETLVDVIRQVGRLNADKAIAIARQLGEGLAVMHDRGVIHRDLKPANVMLDRDGEVRIMDFGLAAPIELFYASDGKLSPMGRAMARAGTPAYMAPEQWEGRPLSEQTDVYALGLVLYELFTGTKAFRAESVEDYRELHLRGEFARPANIVPAIPPAVDRVIVDCLAGAPEARPSSVREVVSRIPVGDPFALARSAGRAPSPESVWIAGEGEETRGRSLATWGAGILVALALFAWLGSRVSPVAREIGDADPRDLAAQAWEISRDLAFDVFPRMHGYWGFGRFRDDPRIYFWYRSGPEPLRPVSPLGAVRLGDPPSPPPGSVEAVLTPDGTLQYFRAYPKDPAPVHFESPWMKMLRSARLHPRAPVAPVLVGDVEHLVGEADVVDAPESDAPVRFEAIAHRGQILSFSRSHEGGASWVPRHPALAERSVWTALRNRVLLLVLIVVVILGLHNRSIGPGDPVGARRVAIAFLVLGLLFPMSQWSQSSAAVSPFPDWTFWRFTVGLALGDALLAWIFYLGVEPTLRRLAPESLISWVRLLRGRLLEYVVLRDLHLGVLLGVLAALSALARAVLTENVIGADLPPLSREQLAALFNSGNAAGFFFFAVRLAAYASMVALLVLSTGRVVLRHRILVGGFFGIAMLLFWGFPPFVGDVLVWAAVTILMLRFGILVLLAFLLTASLLICTPITVDPSHWYFGASLPSLVLPAGIALVGIGYGLLVRPRRLA